MNDRRLALLLALGLAWVGIWGAWIPHPTASLAQNAVDLAEWSTFLLDVRSGAIPLAPEILRLAVTLAIGAAAVGLHAVPQIGLRWLLRILALAPALVMLPPYTALLTPFAATGYRMRLIVSVLAFILVAAALLLDQLPDRPRHLIAAGLSIGAIVCAVGAFNLLRGPFSAHYTDPIRLGIGGWLFILGLAAAALLLVTPARMPETS
ncbi:MAG: hypothetical protein GYB64_03035 [Chloroflexi bacterium]|nr:hypothetical protein [Chloroflexota bacterium]